jgi:hypothetical protein
MPQGSLRQGRPPAGHPIDQRPNLEKYFVADGTILDDYGRLPTKRLKRHRFGTLARAN